MHDIVQVLANDHMSGDHRNFGIVGTADGVPLFEDQRRGIWVFAFRNANLPTTLSNAMSNAFVSMVSANEYMELDEATGKLRRVIRAPKCMKPHMTIIADDLKRAYVRGVRAWDAETRKTCRPKPILLYWTADYPGRGDVAGTFENAMCHWCEDMDTESGVRQHMPEVSRLVWSQYRRWLPANHPTRTDSFYGRPERRGPPPLRTHESYLRDACAQEEWNGPKNSAPHKKTGIKQYCPLADLPMWDMAKDFVPDMMHIISGIWSRHIFDLLLGSRQPAEPQKRKHQDAFQAHQFAYRKTLKVQKWWQVTKEQKAALDFRSRSLGGLPGWIRNNLEVCTHKSALKSHDWIHLVQAAGPYLLRDLYGGHDQLQPDCQTVDAQQSRRMRLKIQEALLGLVRICNKLLNLTSGSLAGDVDDRGDRDMIDLVRVELAESLSLMEAVSPLTDLPVILHILIHTPDTVYRWNGLRNSWSFFAERTVGWVIRHVQNRDLAVENICRTLSRRLYVASQPVGVRQRMLLKMGKLGISLHQLSCLKTTDDFMADKGDTPGDFTVQVKSTRRNTTSLRMTSEQKTKVEELCRKYSLGQPQFDIDPDSSQSMSAGIRINGRPYSSGDFIEYRENVSTHLVRTRQLGVDLDDYLKIAIIDRFHIVRTNKGCSRPVTADVVFVSLQVPPDEYIVSRQCEEGIYELHKNVLRIHRDANDSNQPSHGFTTQIIHIDRVAAKIHTVSHWDESVDNMVCGIRVWHAT